jgi:hypothetical protein
MTAITLTPVPALWRRGGRSVAAAAIADVALWLIVRATYGPLQVTSDGSVHAVTVPGVLLSTAVAGVAGLVLATLLVRFVGKPVPWWLGIAGVALLLSLGGPLSGAPDAITAVTLVAMHLVVGALVIPAVARALATQRR